MNVTLNEAEQRLAKYLAGRRHGLARENGRHNGRIGPQSDEETDLEGIGAEIAFCKLFNCYPDTEVGHTPDFDATVLPGRTVDVKATRYHGGRLLAVLGKKGKPPDFYALMIGSFPTYRCAGFMRADDLLQDVRIKDLGRGPGFAAEQIELQTAEEWWRDYEVREGAPG